MENSININNIINLEDSFEIGNNINELNSIKEKCEYYKQEYLIYKSKFDYINNENNKLIKERNKLLFQIGILKRELKQEKNSKIKNDVQNKNIILNDNNSESKYIINTLDNDKNFDLEKEIENLNMNAYHKNDNLNDSIFKTLKEETNEQNKILNELNNEKEKNNQELEEKVLLTIESMNFGDDEEDHNEDESINNKFQSEKNLVYKSSLNKNNQPKIIPQKKSFTTSSLKIKEILAQKNLIINSILGDYNKINDLKNTNTTNTTYNNQHLLFDDNILEKSLTTEFIDYKKDSINFRKLINLKEQKINNLHTLLKRWGHYSKILKKGIETFYKSIEMFNKNLLNTQKDSFIENPDLLGLIFLLQKNLNDIIEHCKSFINTLDSLFILQLENYLKKTFHNIKVHRYNLALKISELIYFQNKFLSTKKSLYNSSSYKSAKNNYYLKYKTIEIFKYEYLCNLNKILMMKQIELPQLISLLTFSIMVFFRQIHNVLKEIDEPIKDNLEKINARITFKNKIIEKMKKDKKELENKLFNKNFIDKNLMDKEGFVNIKENENNSNFKRKYIKIHEGNIIAFKTKKSNLNAKEDGFDSRLYLNMIERIDLNDYSDLCNLLLSNVKKSEKKHEYPFCFEIVDASTKKNYILQANTEYETEEWVCSIQNAISDRISNFKDKNEKNVKNNEIKNKSNSNLIIKEEEDNDSYNKNINNIIDNNICSDCGAKMPTWLCINWLTIICIDCSAIHRGLGSNISKVKGFRLDNISNDLIELLNVLKQDEIKKIIENKLLENEKPTPDSKNDIKEKFIIDKYKNKKYFEKSELNNNKEDIIKAIIKAIDENNLLDVYKYIKQYINDINEIININGEEYGFLHYCAGKGTIQMVKLLCTLGADINKEDIKGLKPIIYAKLNKNVEIIDFLNKKDKI